MTPREHAIDAICSRSGEPKTAYEINMVKMLTEFAERVLSDALATKAGEGEDTKRLDWWGGDIRNSIDRAMAEGKAARPSPVSLPNPPDRDEIVEDHKIVLPLRWDDYYGVVRDSENWSIPPRYLHWVQRALDSERRCAELEKAARVRLYQACARHIHLPLWISAAPSAPLITVCPHCEREAAAQPPVAPKGEG